jgi:predicted acyl esterase
VGLNGVSYFGINQWHVASLQPPHLAAMCIWEGAADWYRDMTHHGGIVNTFWGNWFDMQVKTVQHGLGERGPKSRVTGVPICGDGTLSDRELAANRCDFGDEILAHPLEDDYHRARSPQWDRITVPFLSAANWGGQGLHPRGNFEGFVRAASKDKWLEAHGLEHWTHFYTDYGVDLQKRFFARFLKGDRGSSHEQSGSRLKGERGSSHEPGSRLKGERGSWDAQPRVQLQVRHVDRFVERHEAEWPIARTQWTKMYLGSGGTLRDEPAKSVEALSFDALGEGATFISPPLDAETEITGPLAARLYVSSSTEDADLFLVFRVFTPDLREVVFMGAIDPHTPVAQGWLRASHRKLDEALSKAWRPYHTHDERQPLTAGEVVPVDVELWPTSIVVPAGHRLALTVRGRDYEYANSTGARLSNFKNELKGCGPFLHDDPRDRPKAIFGGRTTLHIGPEHPAYVLVPIIPAVHPSTSSGRTETKPVRAEPFDNARDRQE